MTINPKDDYNTLGSLFYPSIEASGNVYYGQTRKLAIDELFNTSNGGFSSCIVTRPLDSDDRYFSWELGPLKGCLKICDVFYNSDNVYFAKYNVKVKNNEPVVYDVIDSGQFPTYSKNVYIELDKDQPYVIGAINPVTINDPEKAEAWDGRNFYVDVDKKILYIAIAEDSLKKEITKAMTYPSQEELEQPLTFENIGTETTCIRLYNTDVEKNANSYEYRIINENGDESDWTLQSNYDELDKRTIVDVIFSNTVADSVLDIDGSIRLKPGCKVQYRLAGEYSQPTSSAANIRFMTIQRSMPGDVPEDPNLSLSGNIASMIAKDSKIYSTIKDSSGYYYCHREMFYSCKCIKSAKDLIIPYEVVSSEFNLTFSLCTSLLYAPYIYIKKMVKNRQGSSTGLNELFSYCRSLLEPPPILPMVNYIESDVTSAYSQMFYRCYSLHKVPLIPLTKCTTDALFYMFRECSDLTRMPVILSSELNNLYYGGLYNGRKSLQGAFVGTKIKAIYCAATSDSSPSSKPKLSEWLPIDIQKIYVPSNCPPNFWESVDEEYAGRIVKINDEMDANEYPQHWTKSASHSISMFNSYTDNSGQLYSSYAMFSPEYFATTIGQEYSQERLSEQFAVLCAPLGIDLLHYRSHDESIDSTTIQIGNIDSKEQIRVESPEITVRVNEELNLESPNINISADEIFVKGAKHIVIKYSSDSDKSIVESAYDGSISFHTKINMDKNPFSNPGVDDSYKRFYANNGFNISIIAIVLSDSGDSYVCPGDIIKYDRRTGNPNNPTISLTQATGLGNRSITINGSTRITGAIIKDVYLAIMTPSGYITTEFRALGSATFKILSFGKTASGSNTIYVLTSMEE